MPKAFNEWTVLPHSPPRALDENLWRVTGEMPRGPMKRHMTVARRSDGRLVIHSAIALDDAGMAELETWGEPGFLLVPNGFHRLDAAIYTARYPKMQVYCPRGSRARVEQVVAVDGSYEDYPRDEAVFLHHLEGVKEREGVMVVRSDAGASLVFNDTLFNLAHGRGVGGVVMRLLGSSGGPRVTRIGKLFLVADRRALRAHLIRLARMDVCRLVPGHGEVMEDQPSSALRAVADSL